MAGLLYTFVIFIYAGVVRFAAFFSKKARLRVNGVKSSKAFLDNFTHNGREIVFMHCSSQGESEQALPIILWILNHTKYHVVISFFSPSGYENFNPLTEDRFTKMYLPFDLPGVMIKLVEKLNPVKAIIIKNEWWWNLFGALRHKTVETFLVSSTIRSNHYFLRYPIPFFLKRLNTLSKVFVVDEPSKRNLSKIYNGPITIGGDTRMDQVLQNKNLAQKSKTAMRTLQSDVIIYGSVWEEDMPIILEMMRIYPDHNHIIFPHLLDESSINYFHTNVQNSKIIDSFNEATEGTMIVTRMGELKYAYQHANIAYVGGGFGGGIHNILESAVYCIPTLFGPDHTKSAEAVDMVEKELVFTFSDTAQLHTICNKISEEKFRKKLESNLLSYFSPKRSPTEIICRNIFHKELLND